MDALIIAACCFAGSVLSGFIGWLKSGEPFEGRKFLVTVLSGVGAALVFGLSYQFTEAGLTIYAILAAIMAGMGIDVGVNRVAGAVATLKAKKS